MGNALGNKEVMAKNIRYYMDLNNLSRREVCQAIGVKYTTFTDWVNGNVYPRIDKIELMAKYFGVSKSDLVEEHDQKTLTVSPDEMQYIQMIRELDIDGFNFVMNTIENEYTKKKRMERYEQMILEGRKDGKK